MTENMTELLDLIEKFLHDKDFREKTPDDVIGRIYELAHCLKYHEGGNCGCGG